ncbi:MAG: hypothetical protein KC502_00365 [Myxococcales bacterium]|nr:hypothetical protein [Myxococcales bacterium]
MVGEQPRPRSVLFAAIGSGLAVLALWLLSPSWSASAATLLDGAGGGGGALRTVGRVLKGDGAALKIQVVWATMGVLNAAGLVLVAYFCGAKRLSWLAALLVLLIAPDSLCTVGIEVALLLATLTVLLSGHLAERHAIGGSLLLGFGLLLAALVSPLGLPGAMGLAVVGALFPRPSPAPGVASRPIALSWFAGVALAGAAIVVAFPGDNLLNWWNATIGALRKPAPIVVLGGMQDTKAIGGLLSVLLTIPVVPALLAVRWAPARGPIAAGAVWWLVCGLTLGTFPISTSTLIAPLLIAGGLGEAVRWLNGPNRATAAALAAVLLLCGWVDRTHRPDPRSTLGAALSSVGDSTAVTPLVLRSDDVELMAALGAPANLFPDRFGARPLIKALKRLGVVSGKSADWDAFAADFVVVRQPPLGPVASGWHLALPVARCNETSCVLHMADGKAPSAAKRDAKKTKNSRRSPSRPRALAPAHPVTETSR